MGVTTTKPPCHTQVWEYPPRGCVVLPLTVETGRYININLEEKKCECCLLNKLEDENHFVCTWKQYFIHRQYLYNIVSREIVNILSKSDNDKLIYLMNNNQRQLSNINSHSLI